MLKQRTETRETKRSTEWPSVMCSDETCVQNKQWIHCTTSSQQEVSASYVITESFSVRKPRWICIPMDRYRPKILTWTIHIINQGSFVIERNIGEATEHRCTSGLIGGLWSSMVVKWSD